ncbi:MAG TPA: iron ABC transporter permease, partial [Candidatus Binatia bacterium]
TSGALALGVALAWLVERTELPGRRWWSALLAAPLIVPSYLAVIAYESLLGRWGLLADGLNALGGHCLADAIPEIEGFAGAALVLILGTYPYVYLLVRAALGGLSPAVEDAACAAGRKPGKIFWTVTLPLVRPALAASALLVAVTVIADFGVVERMKFPTFTTAVYHQLTSRFDRSTASALSAVLIAGTLALLWAQRGLWGRGRHYYLANRRPQERRELKSWRWPAALFVLCAPALALVVPVAVFGYWMIEGWLKPSHAHALWATAWSDLLRHAWHGFLSAGLAATLALGASLPMAFLAVRHRGERWGGAFSRLSQAGFVLPGVLVALALAYGLNRYAPYLYFNFTALVIAYVVLFFPLAFQALESGLSQVPEQLEDSARLLRHGTLGVWRRVTLPLLLPAALAGWVLVFTNALRELPATLLLRPAGFDTLPVRIWIAAGEGFLTQAAPAALLLVVLSLPLLFLLGFRDARAGRLYD